MKKQILALALLVLTMTLSACGGEERTEFRVGEEVSTYWFKFTVESVEQTDCYEGREAAEGSRLLLCELSLENTFDGPVPMGQGDFVLLWEDETGTEQGAFPLAHYTQSQLPDEYDLAKDEERTGLLIYEVPKEVAQAWLLFEEQYVSGESESDYSVGERFTVGFTIQ